MCKKKGVTHEDIKDLIGVMPKYWTDDLDRFSIYYCKQTTAPTRLVITEQRTGDINPALDKVPVKLKSLYTNTTRRRVSNSKIDSLLYPQVKELVRVLRVTEQVSQGARTDRDILRYPDDLLTESIAPFTWVSTGESASVVLYMSQTLQGVSSEHLQSGITFEDYVKSIIWSGRVRNNYQVEFDSDDEMFGMYGVKGSLYDLYDCARLLSKVVNRVRQGR